MANVHVCFCFFFLLSWFVCVCFTWLFRFVFSIVLVVVVVYVIYYCSYRHHTFSLSLPLWNIQKMFVCLRKLSASMHCVTDWQMFHAFSVCECAALLLFTYTVKSQVDNVIKWHFNFPQVPCPFQFRPQHLVFNFNFCRFFLSILSFLKIGNLMSSQMNFTFICIKLHYCMSAFIHGCTFEFSNLGSFLSNLDLEFNLFCWVFVCGRRWNLLILSWCIENRKTAAYDAILRKFPFDIYKSNAKQPNKS